MSSTTSNQNAYLDANIGRLFAATSLPIICVMGMNGLMTVTDAILLGIYVGSDAVGAIATVFPISLLLIAGATLIGSGMASMLARHLGAKDLANARITFGAGNILALALAILVIAAFMAVGKAVVLLLTNGSPILNPMAYTYIATIVFFYPVQILLSVNCDALRCEGRAGLMALASLFVSLANLVLNYFFIASLELGVAGSAYGTVIAQGLALGVVILFRIFGQIDLRFADAWRGVLFQNMKEMIALGLPQSLGFVGLLLVSTAIMTALQWVSAQSYDVVISAYGIITRIITCAFLPLLGISQSMQAIVGNNVGAGLLPRANRCFRLGVMVSMLYCLAIETMLLVYVKPIGAVFSNDPEVADRFARIVPVMVSMHILSGPLLMIGSYFQAIGDAKRAAILGIAKPYLFTIPLIIILACLMGEKGIWLAMPISECLLLIVSLSVLTLWAKREKVPTVFLQTHKGGL
ncbi:MATE family efflux transporter [Rhizobium sp.]|jgi:putative MATE family efflux protein|uniref:MATE family efflux transporter n=1 Tax=Rhizobium sp. TaxID=391 RepID=UPI000E98A2AA|nr:MATE family efflux transporter [Rhizobium sp.]